MIALAEAIRKLESGENAMPELMGINPKLAQVVAFSGAGSAQVLEQLINQHEFQSRVAAEVELAKIAANQTRIVILCLPLVSLFLGGEQSLRFLITQPLGWIVMFLASSLIWLASHFSAKKLAEAMKPVPDPGFDLQLVALAVSAGMHFASAYRLVGVSQGPFTLREIAIEISKRRSEVEQTIRVRLVKLPNSLIFANGLLILPATMLLVFAPPAIAGFSHLL